MRAIAVAVLAALLALAACSGDDSKSGTSTTTAARATTTTHKTTTTSRAAATTTSAATTTTKPCATGGATDAQSSPMPSDVMLLTAVHVATKPCVDTITFDFTSGAPQQPGYRVSYQPGPFTQDASGKPVTVKGSAFLVVRLEPATGFDFNNNRETYTGPDRVPPPAGAAWVQDLVRTGDFESVTTWVIGLKGKVKFTATGTGAPNHHLTVTLG